MKIKILSIILLSVFVFTGCVEKLNVDNNTDPSFENVYADGDAVYSVAAGLFYSWYINAQTHSWSPQMAMMTMADQGTSSWLNSGMFDLSSEPRVAFDNSETYSYAYIFEHYWEDLYTVLNTSNDILNVLHNGMEIGEKNDDGIGEDTKLVESFSYFIQGISLGYLGLTYDKAFIMRENTQDPVGVQAQPYSIVIDSAINSLETCIALCENNTFTVPEDWMNGATYTNTDLAKLAYSYMARFLVYKARTSQENENTDWQTVLEYANNGITSDFQIYMDNVNWQNWVFHYTYERDDWVMVDARIINMMDNSYPWRLDDGTDPGVATSDDARLSNDFVHTNTCTFRPDRGYYHFSYYLYHRLDYSFSTPDFFPEFYVNELQLIKAEANARLGNTSEAISIVNSGSRVNRGNLAPLDNSTSSNDILDAIFYERDLELFVAGFGIGFFDMRRRDMLQPGTMLHFPIPAKELNVLGEGIYTFGGGNGDGINTSNGGWFPEK